LGTTVGRVLPSLHFFNSQFLPKDLGLIRIILEEGSEGVRLMTVHKAKGLEFPVVILADLTCRLSRGDASRYVDPANRLCALRIGGWSPHELFDHEQEEVARKSRSSESVR